MRMRNDGDGIRALGYVALYCGHLERAVDDILRGLVQCGVAIPDFVASRSAMQKNSFCRMAMEPYVAGNPQIAELYGALEHAASLLERKAQVIRDWSVPGFERADEPSVVRHGLSGRAASAVELYSLANSAADVLEVLLHGQMFSFFGAFRPEATGAYVPLQS